MAPRLKNGQLDVSHFPHWDMIIDYLNLDEAMKCVAVSKTFFNACQNDEIFAKFSEF